MLVIDASATTALCLAEDGFDLVSDTLVAPMLLRSEVLSALQGMQWRREIDPRLADIGVDRLLAAPVRLVRRLEVWRRARDVAQSLGWAKTYDAEYVALAQLHAVPLLTIDDRMRRRVESLIQVRTPSDLPR
ncbi:MAG: type II toxin-antitoxin system VapC family toxin [Actinobacteria bacterium]|nr:type II toxin-antitoxin system VapC family toxin [Actinomycetota bacterium]